MSRAFVLVLVLVSLVSLVACGRHVVVEPETALHKNDRAWTVKSEPHTVVVVVNDAGAPN
ncbi:MAG: hypothetical protein JWP87_2285 [Labilithrix sp.]|nr:hypothetical protein [Labilithrix sp.]